jgi:hypothetical protein
MDTRPIDEHLLGIENFEYYKKAWLRLCCSDFFSVNGIKSYEGLQQDTGIRMTVNNYMLLCRVVTGAVRRYNIREKVGINKSIENFLSTCSKSSKSFRRILMLATEDNNFNPGINMIQKLCEIVGIPVPMNEIARKNLGFWNAPFLPVRIRDFALQLVRNSLPVNARLAGRYRNDAEIRVDERCRNCMQYGSAATVGSRETFTHFFWECNYSASIIRCFKDKYFENAREDVFKEFFFLGTNLDSEFCYFHRTLSVLLMFEIWKCRLDKKAKSSIATVELNMLHNFEKIFQGNNRVLTWFTNIDNPWCRKWWTDNEHRRG